MRRREFITLLGGATASWPLVARAQQPERVRRIGVLMGLAASDPDASGWISAFEQVLQKSGWSEGRNIKIEYRWGTGDARIIRAYAAELMASPLKSSSLEVRPLRGQCNRRPNPYPFYSWRSLTQLAADLSQALLIPGVTSQGLLITKTPWQRNGWSY